MKTREEVEHRLRKLVDRHKNRFVSELQSRAHRNCVHNQLHVPTPTPRSSRAGVEERLSPRHQVTLIVLDNDRSEIGICMHGSEDPRTWNGDTCDSDSVSESCPKFQSRRTHDDAAAEFDSLMADDAATLLRYPDIASLQWVLQGRASNLPSWMEDIDRVIDAAVLRDSVDNAVSAAALRHSEELLEIERRHAADIRDLKASCDGQIRLMMDAHTADMSVMKASVTRARNELHGLKHSLFLNSPLAWLVWLITRPFRTSLPALPPRTDDTDEDS